MTKVLSALAALGLQMIPQVLFVASQRDIILLTNKPKAWNWVRSYPCLLCLAEEQLAGPCEGDPEVLEDRVRPF